MLYSLYWPRGKKEIVWLVVLSPFTGGCGVVAAEETLLGELAQGSQRAFGALYERYGSRIYYNLLRIVGETAVAEELLQEVFLKVWEQREAIDPAQSFQAFLFRIARNLAIDVYRKAVRERTMKSVLALTAEEAYDQIEPYVDFKEAASLIEEAIAQLPPQRQRIFRMCRIEGKSYEEVAEALSLTRNTVNDHITKANRFLREVLSRDYGIFLLLLAAAFRW